MYKRYVALLKLSDNKPSVPSDFPVFNLLMANLFYSNTMSMFMFTWVSDTVHMYNVYH